MYLAVIGAAALWLTFVWLGSAIVASLFSEAKGYGEKWGLVTGIVRSVLGASSGPCSRRARSRAGSCTGA